MVFKEKKSMKYFKNKESAQFELFRLHHIRDK